MSYLRRLYPAVLALLPTLLWLGCRPDTEPSPLPGPLRFDQLAEGQQSRYLLFFGERYIYPNSHDLYQYSSDTLVVGVVRREPDGRFLVAEYFTPGSDVRLDPQPNFWDADSTYYYYLSVVADTLRVAPAGAVPYLRSRVFPAEGGLPLALFHEQEVEIQGWKTNLSYCECRRQGFDPEWTLFGQSFANLNVLINNTWMQVDGPGFTHVYSPTAGLVRAVSYSWWTQSGYGYDLLPAPPGEAP